MIVKTIRKLREKDINHLEEIKQKKFEDYSEADYLCLLRLAQLSVIQHEQLKDLKRELGELIRKHEAES